MDDRKAVNLARAIGISVVPTLSIYILAKRRGLIVSVKQKAGELRSFNFRLTDRDYRAVLLAAGEDDA